MVHADTAPKTVEQGLLTKPRSSIFGSVFDERDTALNLLERGSPPAHAAPLAIEQCRVKMTPLLKIGAVISSAICRSKVLERSY